MNSIWFTDPFIGVLVNLFRFAELMFLLLCRPGRRPKGFLSFMSSSSTQRPSESTRASQKPAVNTSRTERRRAAPSTSAPPPPPAQAAPPPVTSAYTPQSSLRPFYSLFDIFHVLPVLIPFIFLLLWYKRNNTPPPCRWLIIFLN